MSADCVSTIVDNGPGVCVQLLCVAPMYWHFTHKNKQNKHKTGRLYVCCGCVCLMIPRGCLFLSSV